MSSPGWAQDDSASTETTGSAGSPTELTDEPAREATAGNNLASETPTFDESQNPPVWVRRVRYTDSETATDYWLVEGGAHSKLSDCEVDFERQLVKTAREYVEQITGKPEAWDDLALSIEELKSNLVPDRQVIQTRENEFGVTYLKYRQLAFDEAFRDKIRARLRIVEQQSRLTSWAVGAGSLFGLLLLSAFVLRGRSCCRGTGSSVGSRNLVA